MSDRLNTHHAMQLALADLWVSEDREQRKRLAMQLSKAMHDLMKAAGVADVEPFAGG